MGFRRCAVLRCAALCCAVLCGAVLPHAASSYCEVLGNMRGGDAGLVAVCLQAVYNDPRGSYWQVEGSATAAPRACS
jgi:hypothetical protein